MFLASNKKRDVFGGFDISPIIEKLRNLLDGRVLLTLQIHEHRVTHLISGGALSLIEYTGSKNAVISTEAPERLRLIFI